MSKLPCSMPVRRCIAFLFAVTSLFAADWLPVGPDELAQKTPVVEKDADSEAIFWNVSVTDEVIGGRPHTVLSHYIRIKIFNDRGRNRWRTISIGAPVGTYISDVSARTIRPDGSIVDVRKDEIHEQNIVKTGSAQVRNISWAMPAVEAGCVIEYRYREARDNRYAHYVPLIFQLGIPARTIRYAIKPYTGPNFRYRMYIEDYNCQHTVERRPDGVYIATVNDVPAFRREPYMPPVDQVRAWSLIYYRSIDSPGPDKFWSNYGKSVYNAFKPHIKVTKAIQAKAAEITSGVSGDVQKLEALSDFCRSHIKNSQTNAVSAEERAEADKNKNPEDTLNQGIGTGVDIDYLFTALAEAAGYDARIAKCANRNQPAFNAAFLDTYFLRDVIVAVKLGDGWHFYEPDAAFVPHDMITQQHEAVAALISDPKEPVLVQTPASNADQNVAWREGHFRLSDDGSLEGNLTMRFTGHWGAERKQNLLRESDALRQERFKNEIKATFPDAEISDLQIENATDPEKPVVYHCHIQAPGYAQRTGKRLFFAPEVFRQNQPARFPDANRRYPVYVPFAQTEYDEVSIDIPPGFAFDAPNVPAAIPLGKVGNYEVKAKIQDGKRLIYSRKFIISSPSGLFVPVESYPTLKKIFDQIAYADQQTMALKVAPAAVSTGGN